MLKLNLLFPVLLLVCITVIGYRFALTVVTTGIGTPDRERTMTRRDAWILLVILLAYGLRAFWGLGDTVAPETFCHFQGSGSEVVVELEKDRTVEQVWYYTGLKTGTYSVSIPSLPLKKRATPSPARAWGHFSIIFCTYIRTPLRKL